MNGLSTNLIPLMFFLKVVYFETPDRSPGVLPDGGEQPGSADHREASRLPTSGRNKRHS
jgi:hypothetical protein